MKMEAVQFKGFNTIYSKNQDPYLQLPAHKSSAEDGCVTSCWRLSFIERISVLFAGRVYLQILTFSHRIDLLPPQRMTVTRPKILQIKKEEGGNGGRDKGIE